MNIRNLNNTPPILDDSALAAHARTALSEFVERRLAEPNERYRLHLKERKIAIMRLFRLLNAVDPENPEIGIVREILLDHDLLNALRYVAGPPISMDDLGVLVTRDTVRLSKSKIKNDPMLAVEILRLICRVADSDRFSWIHEHRAPHPFELKRAIMATTVLHAAQTMQTERRMYGKTIEFKLRNRLTAHGFVLAPTPKGGKINAPVHLPENRSYYGECSIHGRRADLLIGLPDGRSVAVEAKDSSSVVNSVKRVLNDTAAKAEFWRSKFGETVLPVALLSGVFGLDSLRIAQDRGLYLVWAHDLESFMDWLQSQ